MVNLDYLQDTSSKPPKKIKFVICFIIIVVGTTSSAFALWKSHLRNPYFAIQVACSKTIYKKSCFESISRLHKDTYTLSKPGFNKLDGEIIPTIDYKLASGADPQTTGALKKCKNSLSDSLRSIHESMTIIGSVDADMMIFRDRNWTRNLEGKIIDAGNGNAVCLHHVLKYSLRPYVTGAFKRKLGAANLNLNDCFKILYYGDQIHQELNPTIESVLEPVRFYFHPRLVLAYLPYMLFVLLVISFLRYLGKRRAIHRRFAIETYYDHARTM